MSAAQYLYLHGFASGPQSHKAQYLQARLKEVGQPLAVPDLNTGGFFGLTLTRQIEQVGSLVLRYGGPTVLIGSSFGGLTAAWVAEHQPKVEQLVLLAPAFDFLKYLRLRVKEQSRQWREDGKMSLYHYGFQREEPLSYSFVEDLAQYPDAELRRSLPTLIIHGLQDDVIPASASQSYQSARPWVVLDSVEDDHALTQSLPYIWQRLRVQLTA